MFCRQKPLPLIPEEITVELQRHEQPLPKAELIRRLQGKDGLICHIIGTIDDEVLAAAGPEGRLERRRRLQQHRRGGRPAARASS